MTVYVKPLRTPQTRKRLLTIFETLLAAFGRREWWPGDTELEVIVGAVLTQNTSWRNVEKAIANLKATGNLDLARLRDISQEELALIIRSSGFYNIKAGRLKHIVNVIHDIYRDKIPVLREIELWELRRVLLDIDGVGRETADSIMLYALGKPVFVIDAYTRRFLQRHGLFDEREDYDVLQRFFMTNLPHDLYLFNEYHALLVCLGQQYCRKKPSCTACPLEFDLHIGKDPFPTETR